MWDRDDEGRYLRCGRDDDDAFDMTFASSDYKESKEVVADIPTAGLLKAR
jgi:hypothetical protein